MLASLVIRPGRSAKLTKRICRLSSASQAARLHRQSGTSTALLDIDGQKITLALVKENHFGWLAKRLWYRSKARSIWRIAHLNSAFQARSTMSIVSWVSREIEQGSGTKVEHAGNLGRTRKLTRAGEQVWLPKRQKTAVLLCSQSILTKAV